MENSIKGNDSLIKINELTKKDYNEFEIIMSIYQKALNNTIKECLELKEMLSTTYNYDVITNITGRIKSPDSIATKMKKKNLDISYDNMIEHINDIAGVRIVCNYKDEVYKIKYKPKSKLSNSDSIKLSIYARIINDISDKMMKIHRKQTKLLR